MESTEDYGVKLAILETQMDRLISDVESEKATRARVNLELLHRIDESDDRTAEKIDGLRENQRKSDRILWMILGAWALLQFIVPLFTKK